MLKTILQVMFSLSLISCSSISKSSAELNGEYFWSNVFASSKLMIKEDKFEIEEWHHLEHFQISGFVQIENENVKLIYDDGRSLSYRVVLDGHEQYLISDLRYEKFIEKGSKDFEQVYKKGKKNH